MRDSYLESLRSEWQRTDDGFTTVASRFAFYRRRMRRTMVAAFAGSGVVLVCFLFILWTALDRGDALSAVAAIAFVSALPVVAISVLMLRRDFGVRHGETPFGLLLQMRQWSATMHRTLWSARWCARILLFSAAMAWVSVLLHAAPVGAVVTLSFAWIATAIWVWLWQVWRGRRLAEEIARLDQAIAQFRSADQEFDER